MMFPFFTNSFRFHDLRLRPCHIILFPWIRSLQHGLDFYQCREHYIDTRGHSLKLFKPWHRISKRNKFFNWRVINKWNSLTEKVISSPSVDIFKNRYDQFKIQRKMRRGNPYELWLPCLFYFQFIFCLVKLQFISIPIFFLLLLL